MRQIAVKVWTLTAIAVLVLAAQAQAVVTIEVGTVSAAAGTVADLPVTLDTGGDDVAGTENVISFSTDAPIPPNDREDPDCTVNDEIDKGATAFAYQPTGCDETDSCTSVKAIVLALNNVDPIPDGSVLYTCKVAVASGATGTVGLPCSEPGASDPEGVSLDSACSGGGIMVGGGGDPTPTPTQPVEDPEARIVVGSAEGERNSETEFDVTLELPLIGTEVAGTENTITFSGGEGAAIRVKANEDGDPDCAVNPEIDKDATAFAYQPPNCAGGDACIAVKAIVLSLNNVDPIPGDSVLYTCVVEITDTAQDGQTYDLTCSNAGASTPEGMSLITECTNGSITVGEPTPTATAIPDTPAATATRTSIFPPTQICDDGCAIASPSSESQAGWLLLLPAMLLWLRRRSR